MTGESIRKRRIQNAKDVTAAFLLIFLVIASLGVLTPDDGTFLAALVFLALTVLSVIVWWIAYLSPPPPSPPSEFEIGRGFQPIMRDVQD